MASARANKTAAVTPSPIYLIPRQTANPEAFPSSQSQQLTNLLVPFVVLVLASSTRGARRNGRWGSWRARALDLGCIGGGRVGEEGGHGEARLRGVDPVRQQRWRGRWDGRGALPHAEAPAGRDQGRGQEGLPTPHAHVSPGRLQAEGGRRRLRRGLPEDQRGVPDADEQHEGGRGEARVLAPQVRPV